MKFIGYRTLKTGVAAAIAIIIAQMIELAYYPAAGIIAILSVQNSRLLSVEMAWKRFLACLLAIIISGVLFTFIGYNALVFGFFLLIFIPLATKWRMEDGIVVSAVIVTHFLVEKSFSFYWIKNELLLMIVGIGIALLANLYMPSVHERMREDQEKIETYIKQILLLMAASLRNQAVSTKENQIFSDLHRTLTTAKNTAIKLSQDRFYADETYYIYYIEMRLQQYNMLSRMREHFTRLTFSYEQTIVISHFVQQLALSIYENNSAEHLLHQLQLVRQKCEKTELPKTRAEFENRAILFQFLTELEMFIKLKNDFYKLMEEKNDNKRKEKSGK